MNTIFDIINSKKTKLAELRKTLIETEDKEQRMAIGETLTALEKEIADLQAIADEQPAEDQPTEGRSFSVVGTQKKNDDNGVEARANKFAQTNRMTLGNDEVRASVLVSGGTIAQPKDVDGITGLYPQVSSIVDMVDVVDCSGAGAGMDFAYQITDAEAGAHTEGSAASQSEPTFDIVHVTAADKALVSYISNKVRKQSPLTYEATVRDSAMTALRKAASKICVEAVTGSAIADTMAIELDSSNKGILDEKFLRKITLNYGGDEAVMGEAVLFINKADLIALGDVRGSNKQPVYEITPDVGNPNTGIIKDGGLAVKYCINNNCAALAGTAQTSTDVLGAFYGNPKAIKLCMFEGMEVATSEDYRFAEDMMAIRGKTSIGAGMVQYKGFVVAKIAKA